MVDLAAKLRAVGAARYQDDHLGITLEMYPEPGPPPVLGTVESLPSDDEPEDERASLFLGTGAQPPLLSDLAKNGFGSAG